MKHRYLTYLLIIIIPLLMGCATTKQSCPPEDIVVKDPYVGLPLTVQKGFFDEDNHGKGWVTKEEFDEVIESQKKGGI